MRKYIESVKRGDIIMEGRKEIQVKKVEPHACSSLGTHINGSMCYDRGTLVKTKENVDPRDEEYERGLIDELLTELEFEADSRLY